MFGTVSDLLIGYALCVLFPVPFLSQAILNVYAYAYAWVISKLNPPAAK